MNRKMSCGVSALLAFALLQIPHTAVAQSEGIKVHGHWTIDVREPDGTLVTHREFENALTEESHFILASMLRGNYAHGEWLVSLDAVGAIDGMPPLSTSPCFREGQPTGCLLVEGTYAETYAEQPSWISRNLIALEPTDEGLTLKGSITASRDGFIGKVGTIQTLCHMSYSPSACKGNTHYASKLTSVVLAQPQRVVAGQIVQVTVVLSFQ